MKRRGLAVFTALVLAVTLIPATAGADGECRDTSTPIYDIQGDGSSSPMDGDVVTTEGVVTVDLQRTEQQRGFFLQDPDGDGDPSTSDGIFVFQQDTWDGGAFDVSVGDRIRITATVDEFFGLTQLTSVEDIMFCGRGRVGAERLTVRDYNADNEAYEGMYVSFRDLHVTDTFNLHRFGEIWVGQDGVIEQPTNEFGGGTTDMLAFAEDNMDQSMLVDDGSRFSNPVPVPFLGRNGTVRLGDTLTGLTGGVAYGFGQYRIWPEAPVAVINDNARPPATLNMGTGITVASFNVLNYWTTLGGRGADTQEQLDVQTDKLVAAILGMNADVVGLQEIENDPDCGDDDSATVCDHTPTETLVAALNAAAGADVWSWVGPVDHYNQYPIRNEIIYRNDEVTPIGSPVALADPAFDTFRDEELDSQLGRPPIAQTFDADGRVFTVMVNHFKSKGSPCDVIGDPNAGDGQGNCNGTRVAQAQAVLAWIPDLVAAAGDPDVLVIGDLNAYFAEDPIVTLETELVNVLGTFDSDPYSFNFFASFAAPFIGRGALDHALATPSLAGQVTQVRIWHINADEPRFLDWFDPSVTAPGPYRSSDHDPVLVRLNLTG